MENNDANEVPIKVELDPADPLYGVKLKLSGQTSSKSIRVSEDLNEKNMTDFFGSLRFAEFQGDPMTLYKYQIQQNTAKKYEDDDDDSGFKGTNIPPISIANEKRVLNKITLQALTQLKKYPTSYEEDIAILEARKDLTFNQRNAVLMRSGEKHVTFVSLRIQ